MIDARARIAELRAEGVTTSDIARRLNAERIPTATGLVGRWRPEQIARTEHPEQWAAYVREYRRRIREGHVPRQQWRRWT